jgi:glycine/D-amino acid oxidase-like deaminating enzyme
MSPTVAKVDVGILGGGCGGIWLADELTQRKNSCAILDIGPFSTYASTRNQGWLHSGAFYAAIAKPDQQTAEVCKRGGLPIHYLDPMSEHTYQEVPCYFLFDNEEQFELARTRCKDWDIRADPRMITNLASEEPLLGHSLARFALQVDDHPIDTHGLLTRLAWRAATNGAQFYTVSSLEEPFPIWNEDHWTLTNDGMQIECTALVLACGSLIPWLLEALLPGEVHNIKRTKVSVLVLHAAVSKSMLITPTGFDGPNLVPFFGNGKTVVGASVCLTHTDEEITDYKDEALPKDYLRRHSASLDTWLGGIRSRVATDNIPAHFYTCQKVHLAEEDISNGETQPSRTHILKSYSPEAHAPKSIFAFYPGKFTAAPLAVQECADELQVIVEGARTTLASQTPPTIARQQYYNNPTHKLVLDGNQLAFVEDPE